MLGVKFTKRTLDALLIAVQELRTEDGRLVNLAPDQVLQSWVVIQIPLNDPPIRETVVPVLR